MTSWTGDGSIHPRRWWITKALAALAAILVLAAPASAQLRVVNYNVAQLQGDNSAIQAVIAGAMSDDKPGYAVAPHLFIFQEVEAEDVQPLFNMLVAEATGGATYSLATYTNNNEDGAAGAQALFFRTDVLEEMAGSHVDIFTGAGRDADRWRMRLVGYDSPDAEFYIYSMHLKASTGGANEQLRLDGVIAVRNNADNLGDSAHVIYAGDMNFYNENEDGYVEFLSAGNGEADDPLGSGVDWNGSSNALKHSQSPRVIQANNLANGGMDDRFDFQLSTTEFQDGQGLTIMPGSYRTLGNDGNHWDSAINNGNNNYYSGDIPRSNALADALHDASDHLPIVAEYAIPGLIVTSLDADFGRVIQGAVVDLEFSISNGAPVTIVSGSESFDYQAVPGGALSGATISGTLDPLGPADMTNYAVDTSTFGSLVASLTVTVTSGNQGMISPHEIQSAGTVVRHAEGSFASGSDQDAITIPWTVGADTGVATIPVDIHNFGFDADQALLDVDSVSAATAPFQFTGGLPFDIGATPGVLTFGFDTTGAAGTHFATFQIEVSDEDIPGAGGPSILTLDFEVTVGTPIPGDLNGDGSVTLDDLCEWHDNPIDLNDDMVVDNGDRDWLLALIGTTLLDTNGNGVHDDCEVIGPATIMITEIRIDQPSTDEDEYFELKGTPGASLDGLTYLVIGDGSGGSGVIEAVVNLDGQVVPADGVFFAAEDPNTFGLLADFVTPMSFENGDNVTHALVSGFTAASGTDLDTNNDGVLDSTPWTELLDMVALVEELNPPSGTEFSYGSATVGPDGSNVPGHVWRCDDTGDWNIGGFTAPTDDTPGAPNAPCNAVCVGDTNGSGAVDIDDIVNVVLDFGTDGSANGGDVDGSGFVDIDDIVLVVLNFGPCP